MLSLDQIQVVFNGSTNPTALFSPSDDPVFVAVNDGFCIVEVFYHEAGKPANYRFPDINPAFQAQR